MNVADYIIVGSGCSGAMVAQTLIEAGAKVLMLDVGTTDNGQQTKIPAKDYLTIRHKEQGQADYLIGKRGQGISWGAVSKGAQITPPRQYMTRLVDQLIPLASDTFKPLESLGYGGLGIGWGLQCWEYSDADLRRTSLPVPAMRDAYELISQRIGISASRDDAARYTLGELQAFQASANADRNHRYIQRLYAKNKREFQRQGFYVGRTPLALITHDRDDRLGYRYHDMDFYSDADKSAWRPAITIDALRREPNFTYKADLLVTHFQENDDTVTVSCLNTNTQQRVSFHCRKLILCSGALGTARIVLRSLGGPTTKLSLLSNAHSYIPCFQPSMLGQGEETSKLGLGQLSYFIDTRGDDNGLSVASSYSYQSLMSFRIVSQMPLNFADARLISQYILPSLVILIAQHPDKLSASKYLQLKLDKNSLTGDRLFAQYVSTKAEDQLREQRERQYTAMMRRLRTYALKRVDPGHGSGIHYAGTLPYDTQGKEFSLDPSGRINGLKRTFVADSSGFTYLPAKGLTFSLMANAHITAGRALENHG